METEKINVNHKKRIGIYSGSFNPIHVGHLEIAKHIIDKQIVDEVWFVVSPCNPLKRHEDLIDDYIRLDMLILAIQNNAYFKVSDIEFTMPIPSYTIDTLHVLSSQYADYQFYLIIGSDNALVFDQWKDYALLLSEYPILVYPRLGYNHLEFVKLYPEMILLDSPYHNVSSTQIRDFIAQKKDVSQWLHPSVYQYIIENNIYV